MADLNPVAVYQKQKGKTIGLAVEYGVRKTFTDYLDDVSRYYADPALLATTPNGDLSQKLSDRRPEIGLEPAQVGSLRGNPDDNDKYLLLMFSITKRLGSTSCYLFQNKTSK